MPWQPPKLPDANPDWQRIEDQFKEHVAMVRPGFPAIRWGKPNSNNCCIEYYLVGGTLFIRGDMGEATFSWHSLGGGFHGIANCDFSYFMSKCEASDHGSPWKAWSSRELANSWPAGLGEYVDVDDEKWAGPDGRTKSKRLYHIVLGTRWLRKYLFTQYDDEVTVREFIKNRERRKDSDWKRERAKDTIEHLCSEGGQTQEEWSYFLSQEFFDGVNSDAQKEQFNSICETLTDSYVYGEVPPYHAMAMYRGLQLACTQLPDDYVVPEIPPWKDPKEAAAPPPQKEPKKGAKSVPHRESIPCSVEEVQLENDNGKTVDGVRATCTRCDHTTESFGTGEKSVKRCLALMREECPEGETNFYVEE